VLLQGALLLVAAATVTALVGLPYCRGGHWNNVEGEYECISHSLCVM